MRFNDVISIEAVSPILRLLASQQFLNNFIIKFEQVHHNTFTFLLTQLKAFHFQTKNHQNLCFSRQMTETNTINHNKSSYFLPFPTLSQNQSVLMNIFFPPKPCFP